MEQVAESLGISKSGTTNTNLSSVIESVKVDNGEIKFKFSQPILQYGISLAYIDWAIFRQDSVE